MFVDTRANCNTISRTLFEQLVNRGLVSELVKGPEAGVRINLVGGQTLGISGDKAKLVVDVATNIEIKTSIQEFLILEHDSEPLVIGVQWHSSLFGENCGDSTRLVNMDTFGQPMAKPLEAIEDKASRLNLR